MKVTKKAAQQLEDLWTAYRALNRGKTLTNTLVVELMAWAEEKSNEAPKPKEKAHLIFARLVMRNDTHCVDFPDTVEGMKEAEAYRAAHSAFYRRKIRAVMQLSPGEVPLREPYLYITIR